MRITTRAGHEGLPSVAAVFCGAVRLGNEGRARKGTLASVAGAGTHPS
jgi:hypothetical protein